MVYGNICRRRNPDAKQFTFIKKHVSGFMQRRLDFIFVSNSRLKIITHSDFLLALSTDPSPIIIPLSKNQIHGHGF